MNLSSYSYANQSSDFGRNAPLHPATQTEMYSSNSVNISHGGAGSPTHAAMYAAAALSSAHSASYQNAMQSTGGGAPQITQQQQQQGAAASYNTYDWGASRPNTANAAGRPGDIFYSGPTMAGHPSAAGQAVCPPNTTTAALFQINPSSSSLTQQSQSHQQQSAVAQMLSQQQQQLNANAAVMAAYGNPATNINMGYKLFVGQVPAVCTEEQLRPLFSQFGRLWEIKIMRESNGRSRGSAWVRYESEISAQRAIEALNEKHVVPPQTNALRVQFATPNQHRTQASSTEQRQQQSPMHPTAARAVGTFITQKPQQPQPATNYTTATYTSAPQGYAPAPDTAYLPQRQYASPNVISYSGGGDGGAFTMRVTPQSPQQLSPPQAPQQQQQHQALPQQQQQQQTFPRCVEYVRAGQSGGGMLYTTSVSTAAADGQMRAGVLYAPEGFTVPNQMPSAQQPQQQQQWRS